MKYVYTLTTCLFVMLLMFLVSCSRDITYQEALNKNAAKFDDPKMVEDANFLVSATSMNILMTDLLKLAGDTAYASVVKDLSTKNFPEHEQLGDEIEKLARKRKVRLPNRMSDEHQQIYTEVSTSNREDFDQKLIHAIKRVNEEGNNRYSQMATQAYDADVRAFAARKLDIMRAHEQRIRDAETQLLSTYRRRY